MENVSELAPRLRMAVLRLARRLRQQSEGDVTASMLSALATLDRCGALTLGELAGAERVQPPTMTRVVARLEELGLVGREPDPADRRVARVRVGDAGARWISEHRSRKDAYLAAHLDRFTAAEVALLARALPLLERLVADVATAGTRR